MNYKIKFIGYDVNNNKHEDIFYYPKDKVREGKDVLTEMYTEFAAKRMYDFGLNLILPLESKSGFMYTTNFIKYKLEVLDE